MCVIVHQPETAWIDKETARKLWQTNPDGGGFAFVDDEGTLQVTKAMTFQTFWSQFEQARSEHGRRDYLLHMRIATHGAVNLENVHPFQVDDDTVMAHNGVIHSVAPYLPKDDSVSDTRFFVSNVLPELPDGWLDKPWLSDMVDEYVGWSKLMFITTSPKLEKTVYRLGSWEEHEGLYLSNKNGLVEKKKDKKKGKVQSFNYYESSEDWTTWWEHQNTWELDILAEDLEKERAASFIKHDLITVNANKLEYQCGGCMRIVDIETGECECWNMACIMCWEWAARCDCEVKNLVDFNNLTEQGKDKLYANESFNEETISEMEEAGTAESVVVRSSGAQLPEPVTGRGPSRESAAEAGNIVQLPFST